MQMSDLYWLAGWLEGEGSFMIWKNIPIISGVTTDLDVASRVAALLGRRVVSAGKPAKAHHKPAYGIRMKGREAMALMLKLRPLMGLRRQTQIDSALERHVPVKYRIGPRQLVEISRLLARNETHAAIAERYGVSRAHVTHIANGRVPKWLT